MKDKTSSFPDFETGLLVGAVLIGLFVSALSIFSKPNEDSEEESEVSIEELNAEMSKYAVAENYEKAAEIRDLINKKMNK